MKKMTLTAVKRCFDRWRQTRANKKVKIPDSLWRMALSLKRDYRVSEITKTLGLCGGAFQKMQLLYSKKSTSKPTKQKFARVAFESSNSFTKPVSRCVEVKRQDGASMVIQILDTEITNILTSFLGGSYATNYTSK